MIVLDTNVISELMRTMPDPAVLEWLDQQPAGSLWTSSVTVFEIRFGIARLPAGRRQDAFRETFERILATDLDDRVIAFDQGAAALAADFAARQRAAGRPSDVGDVQIAGIVAQRRATLATRNTKHFEGLDLNLVNPWSVG